MNIHALKYRFNPDVIFKTVPGSDGEEIIIAHNPETGDMYEFNDIGSYLLPMFAENLPMDQMLARILSEFDATEEEISADVIPFVERLIDLGMVELL